MELFTQAQANKILSNIPYTTTRDWAKAGYFQWHGGPEDGRGRHRLFSRVNLYQIALCSIFIRNANIRPQSIKRLVELYFVTDNKDEATVLHQFNQYLLIAVKEGEPELWACSEHGLRDMLMDQILDNTITSIINLKKIKDEVDNAIKSNFG